MQLIGEIIEAPWIVERFMLNDLTPDKKTFINLYSYSSGFIESASDEADIYFLLIFFCIDDVAVGLVANTGNL
jgi:hypothetical protein